MPNSQANHSVKIARFGLFELNLNASELRKNGVKLRLQEQPFQVLVLLLERAGDVVNREDLQQKLWPSDTFVDFDHSLNTAVNKLRETLGDSASPTLHRDRRSPRLPLHRSGANQHTDGCRAEVGNLGFRNAEFGNSESFPQCSAPRTGGPIPRRGLTRGLFALIQVMYLIFYLAALFHLHPVLSIADSLLPGWRATALVVVVTVTAACGIPLRFYLLSAVGFDYQRLGEKFQQIFPVLLALDELWAIAPFLLLHKIGLGAALAASAALLYVPFSERTLLRMAYMKAFPQVD
jgi:cholera toxin transcriptional activator